VLVALAPEALRSSLARKADVTIGPLEAAGANPAESLARLEQALAAA
jgi:hypothetical protein